MTENSFSHIVPHTEVPGESGPVRRTSTGVPPVLAIPSAERPPRLIATSYENFRVSVSQYPDAPYLGHRGLGAKGEALPYKWENYKEVGSRVDQFASGLMKLGLCPSVEDVELKNRGVLGLFSVNRPEWVIAEQACFCYSLIPVPMYDTLNVDTFALLVNQVKGLRTVVCSISTAKTAIAAKSKCPRLQCLVVMTGDGGMPKFNNIPTDLRILSFSEIEKAGGPPKSHPPHHPPTQTDIFTFCYTSGTSGEPKGALISHGNLITNLSGISACIFPLVDSDVHLSYLPLPHMMERVIQAMVTWAGGSIGFFQGDPIKILDDLLALRPTIFPSVPRVLNRLKDRVNQQIHETGGLAQRIFDWGMKWKQANLLNPKIQDPLSLPVFDILFERIKVKLGLNRVRGVLTGSAPIAGSTLSWLRALLGVPVMEGYGMTECTLVATIQSLNDFSVGNVGGPIPGIEIKLVDVKEMGYLSSDKTHGGMSCEGRGEIWLRGPSVFKGYYGLPDKTAETISDGWLKTGDIALWTIQGQLKIIDRKKNIFKLANGEYVASEKIEAIIVQVFPIMQVFVFGDSFRNSLVSVIVPNPETFQSWANTNLPNMKSSSIPEMCKNNTINSIILRDIQKACTNAGLLPFEIVRAIHIEPIPWNQDTLLTPTFKLKRADAAFFYAKQIDQMYQSLQTKAKL